ncbi:TctA family tripartite tricarboxylate transporter protein (plasmid) [Rhizobium etli 8C-3]|uniref:TctA family tripartite tricarboxylate transporter protein n=1 Tax=Rhizobium etli 8C-3 TaxID=538025 RepID=A0A1L5PAD8_RHIET|nr:tripartite tricarboxylate transporter permease [Rhizobium etli]APO77074.1 TctA family tripartite tricarboxylate transporter protein [Rhizobium etli 8C-3]
MELFSNLATGFAAATTLYNLLFCLAGVMIGTLIGVLPGIGATATIAILLPITYQLEPISSLIMLAGIYYGAQYGGSTTAILINMPGESSAAVTAIDGYQMARNGRAGVALAIAAIGSFVAGTFATLLVAIFAKPLTAIALEFGPAEYFSLMVLGLVFSTALAHGSIVKALGMLLLGLLLSMVGTDLYTGEYRFTLGIDGFADGLEVVAVAVGVFGIAEILRNLENPTSRDLVTRHISSLMPTREDFRAIVGPIVRGTGIGSVLGILPGGGPILAAFASYTIEKRVSNKPGDFGRGAIAGVAGPESANNAGAQTSFIPLLTLGIPANPVLAMLIGAMFIQGIVPGPNVVVEQPTLFWGIIASMWIGNLMLVVLNLPLVGMWVKLLSIPYNVLFPAVMVFCAIGVFSVHSNSYDLIVVSLFGLAGYLLGKIGCEPAPLMLGFILGPMLEENLRRAMTMYRGDPTIFFVRPISAVLMMLALMVLALTLLPNIRRKREEIFQEED